MKTLQDEDLILYFYGEAENPDEISELLGGSAELRARYDSLCLTLETAREAFPVPPRPESFGAEVWERLRGQLEPETASGRGGSGREGGGATRPGTAIPFRAGRVEPPAHRPDPPLPEAIRGRRWGWIGLAAAAVLLLGIGFLGGRLWPTRPSAPQTLAAALPAAARERILVRTVAAHLESSERLLTEITNAGDSGDTDLAAERQWARDLLTANRLYRQSAERGGSPRLAALLDELEPFLLELAHSPSEAGGEEIAELRSRLAEQSLLFKVRVVSQRLAAKQTL